MYGRTGVRVVRRVGELQVRDAQPQVEPPARDPGLEVDAPEHEREPVHHRVGQADAQDPPEEPRKVDPEEQQAARQDGVAEPPDKAQYPGANQIQRRDSSDCVQGQRSLAQLDTLRQRAPHRWDCEVIIRAVASAESGSAVYVWRHLKALG